MFADYRSRVIQEYADKKAANALEANLINATPAKIKNECKRVWARRPTRKDEKVLRDFFDESGDLRPIPQAIDRCDTDRFKPLANFLKGGTTSTEDKNIELLAWLIDFAARPYQLGVSYYVDREEDGKNLKDSQQQVEGEEKHVAEKVNSKNLILKILVSALILTLIGFALFWQLESSFSGTKSNEGAQCMYWAGDQYLPIPCSEKLRDTIVVALDSIKLRNFKRITTPDTITKMSIGNVWYIKRNGNLEYYTSSGFHPVDFQRRLRPITSYIIEKYIKSNTSN